MALVLPGEWRTNSAAETHALGRRLAGCLGPGSVVLLHGELGTGKTCLIKGIAQGLGIDHRRVHSPSFTMVNRHQGAVTLHHVDLYRLQAGEDFSDLALPDLFAGPDVTVVEWAERLPPAARPAGCLEIHLSHTGEDTRHIRIIAV